MGSLFRSEEITLCQLFLQSEAAYACVSELGELGLAQFRDLNPEVNAFQRKFVNEVRRCDEMERKLRYLEKELQKDDIPILDTGENPEAPRPWEIIDLEVTFEKLENELREVNLNEEALKRNFLELTELKHVLIKSQQFFEGQEGMLIGDNAITQETNTGSMQLGFVVGVILRDRIQAFERMLWRACKGNVFLRLAEIESPLEDPSTGSKVYKSMYIIFFQGDQLKTRVKKICEGFRANPYPCPDSQNDRREMAMDIMTRIEDLNTVLVQTQDHRYRVLVAAAKHMKNWLVKVRKMKAIYHTLNLFNMDVTQKCLIAECWVPVLDLDNIQQALRRGAHCSDSSVPPILNRVETLEDPPTYNKTNKFTNAFQALVDAYGVANYREVNPAPYTIITFPFLFAIMFGDLGHGIIMALFAAWMILNEKSFAAKQNDNEILNILFGGRYVILLMGLFSMYTGLIYNDVFSKSINLFGSHWKVTQSHEELMANKYIDLDPGSNYEHTPYPIGIDPVWQVAENKIRFLNAYKMKIAIIFGVLHMLSGVFLSIYNYKYSKRLMDLYTMFFPQIIFLLSLFFYMVLLMFIKWVTYSAGNPVETGPGCAPSILITFINMVLFKRAESTEPCSPWMYTGQQNVQHFLVITALVCVPWMLFAKPCLMLKEQKKHYAILTDNYRGNDLDEIVDIEESVKDPALKGRIEDMSEVWIHQAIHTIEYVLGSVSHTASYLRLWALSLAHAQLSEVLWKMVMSKVLMSESWTGGIMLSLVFPLWAILTVSILILMEGLSAFLHTLRLHWVEFQSKFYIGAGYPFLPFSFKALIEQTSQVEDE